MPNENVQLKKGLSTDLPSTYTPGDILFETDTGNMYVDVTNTDNSNQRVQVKDDTKLPLTGGTVTGNLNVYESNLNIARGSTGAYIYFTITPNGAQQSYIRDNGNNFHVAGTYGNLQFNNTPATNVQLQGTNVAIRISDTNVTLRNTGDGSPVQLKNLAIPTSGNDATNKTYVDGLYTNLENEIVTTAAQYLPLKGGTMTGSIDMGDYLITSLGTPQSDTDAANKEYVDSLITPQTIGSGYGNGYTITVDGGGTTTPKYSYYYIVCTTGFGGSSTNPTLTVNGKSYTFGTIGGSKELYIAPEYCVAFIGLMGSNWYFFGYVNDINTSELVIDDGSLS